MPQYRVTYRSTVGREPELVDGERVTVESGDELVIRTTTYVMGNPREIVGRRFRGADVESIDE